MYKFKHVGHCNGGHKGSTKQNNPMDCRNECAKDSTIGYFAFKDALKAENRICACYAGVGCPDDNRYKDHQAYKILRGILSINNLCSKCVYIYIMFSTPVFTIIF
jgi:hypothetical protein